MNICEKPMTILQIIVNLDCFEIDQDNLDEECLALKAQKP